MPIKDPVKRREAHTKYLREVWYPANRQKHVALVAKRRDEIRARVNALKLACIKCGESDPVVLDFHHREPGKKDISISLAIKNGWSFESILAEIGKCDVLCSNDHRREHARR